MVTATTKKTNVKQSPSTPVKRGKELMCCESATQQKNGAKAQVNQSKNCTKIIVKCNCGFSNTLSIRGEGLKELNWNKGLPLKNVRADEWQWETSEQFKKCQFKILINDNQYELGENHTIECGKSIVLAPKF